MAIGIGLHLFSTLSFGSNLGFNAFLPVWILLALLYNLLNT